MSQQQQRSTLQNAVSKIIWNLRSSYQSKIKCSPFEIHFNRKPLTIWKKLASGKPSLGSSDKGKTILSKERANDWNADDRFENGYKDNLISKKNQLASEKGYDTDYAATSKTHTDRIPLQSFVKGKFLRKTNGTISNSTKIRHLKGNISSPYFPNINDEVGQKHESSRRQPKPRKPQPRTRKQVEIGSSDNLTRTRVSRPSSKSRQSKSNTPVKAVNNPPGYLVSVESTFIPSDTSDTSEWEWIAGGFPCRDVARERFFSDSYKSKNQDGITLNHSSPPITNVKTETLEDNAIQVGDQPVECPISIIPAGAKPTSREKNVMSQAEHAPNSQLPDSQDNLINPTEKDTLTDFPVYELVDSADDTTPTTVPSTKPGNDPPIILVEM